MLEAYFLWALRLAESPIVLWAILMGPLLIWFGLHTALFWAAARHMSPRSGNQWKIGWALLFHPERFSDRGKQYRLAYLVSLLALFAVFALFVRG